MDVFREMDKFNRWFGSIVTPMPLSKTSACTATKVNVQVVSILGTELATLALPKGEKVRAVKNVLHLSGHTQGRPLVCQQLMRGSRILSDDETLTGLLGPIMLTFVLLTFDTEKSDALIQAAHRGDVAAVESALTGRADPNHPGEARQTGLHILATQGRLDAVTLLCESGANPAATGRDGTTPVFNAAMGGHLAVVEHLLNVAPETVNVPRENGATPLFVAAQMGYHKVVRLLCARGGDPKQEREDGATPLLVAAQNGQTEVVKHLYRFKADLNTPMHDGATPLFVAAQNGYTATAAFLCEQGAAIDQQRRDLSSPLFIACQKEHVATIRLLCDAGANPDLVRNGGAGAMHILAQKGNVRALRVLVAAGADVNARMQDGAAALSIATQHGNTDATLFLLNAGADVDAAREDGATALFLATQHQHMEVVHVLLKYGADREKATNEGTTPLQVAQLSQNPQLTTLLAGGGVLADVKTGKPRAWSKSRLVPGSRFLTQARRR